MYLLFVIFNIINQVYSHSGVSCTNKISKTECLGYPRYYHFNHISTPEPSSNKNNTFYSSRDREYLIAPGNPNICPQMFGVPEYTQAFPVASIRAGKSINVQHPPRGHSKQPSSPVWIYMHPTPNLFPTQKQLNPNEFKLLAEYPFDNCDHVDQEISWANCTGKVDIPKNLTSGIYTFWWRWDLNKIPYSDCFEINVIS